MKAFQKLTRAPRSTNLEPPSLLNDGLLTRECPGELTLLLWLMLRTGDKLGDWLDSVNFNGMLLLWLA